MTLGVAAVGDFHVYDVQVNTPHSLANGTTGPLAVAKCNVTPVATPWEPSEQQITFFQTFGFLRLPGLFAADGPALTEAFESVFADEENPRIDLGDVAVHGHRPRLTIPAFVDRHPTLAALRTDPRVVALVEALLGPGFEDAGSDGNLYWCDTEWHCDIYGSPMSVNHVKLSFYLDSLRSDSGAPRVFPGTHHWLSPYAVAVRKACENNVGSLDDVFGLPGSDLPGLTLDVDPGDLVLWDYRTIHASYFGQDRRRLFTVNFREASEEAAT